MKLIPINRSNLPKCDVLAYNGIDAPKIGQLLLIDESSVFCIYGQSDEDYIANITHYLPLNQIKPESDTKRTYFLFASFKAGSYITGSRTGILSRVGNNPIEDDFSNWFLDIRKDFSKQHGILIDDVLITSFSCTETT